MWKAKTSSPGCTLLYININEDCSLFQILFFSETASGIPMIFLRVLKTEKLFGRKRKFWTLRNRLNILFFLVKKFLHQSHLSKIELNVGEYH